MTDRNDGSGIRVRTIADGVAHGLIILSLALFTTCRSSAAASIRDLVASDERAARVLESDPIRVEARGCVDLAFPAALAVFLSDDGLLQVQAAYAALLPAGEEPEFTIEQASPRHYFYVNKRGQRSDVFELFRRQTGARRLEVVYYVTSTRFLGPFKALVHVTATDAGAAGVGYHLDVYAYPERAVPRFFARHLHVVERFFRRKSDHMVELTTAVFRQLTGEPQV